MALPPPSQGGHGVITASYSPILGAIFRLSSMATQVQAVGTHSSHVCVTLTFYTPALFAFFTLCFGHDIPYHVHIPLANLYVLLPPMLNSIICTVRNKLVRERLSQMLLRTGQWQ